MLALRCVVVQLHARLREGQLHRLDMNILFRFAFTLHLYIRPWLLCCWVRAGTTVGICGGPCTSISATVCCATLGASSGGGSRRIAAAILFSRLFLSASLSPSGGTLPFRTSSAVLYLRIHFLSYIPILVRHAQLHQHTHVVSVRTRGRLYP